jgi:hypothetical protein
LDNLPKAGSLLTGIQWFKVNDVQEQHKSPYFVRGRMLAVDVSYQGAFFPQDYGRREHTLNRDGVTRATLEKNRVLDIPSYRTKGLLFTFTLGGKANVSLYDGRWWTVMAVNRLPTGDINKPKKWFMLYPLQPSWIDYDWLNGLARHWLDPRYWRARVNGDLDCWWSDCTELAAPGSKFCVGHREDGEQELAADGMNADGVPVRPTGS